VIDGAFALAFVSGVVATVNPCGFAMLPAYLSYFLGLESREDPDGDEPARASVARFTFAFFSSSGSSRANFAMREKSNSPPPAALD
jgi:cytochrome c biogenesis protein CcdA